MMRHVDYTALNGTETFFILAYTSLSSFALVQFSAVQCELSAAIKNKPRYSVPLHLISPRSISQVHRHSKNRLLTRQPGHKLKRTPQRKGGHENNMGVCFFLTPLCFPHYYTLEKDRHPYYSQSVLFVVAYVPHYLISSLYLLCLWGKHVLLYLAQNSQRIELQQ